MQLELRTWGGRRRGAGRKPSGPRPGVPHRIRPAHQARHPLHVTLRAREGLPSLREESIFPALRRGLGQASRRGLRLLEFSVQRDHVHLIVEAADRRALSRGLQGLAIRLAKAINRVLDLRGRIWGDRYHARALRTPREVRNALVYVLQNWKKHLSGVRGIDSRSSGPWFNGWASSVSPGDGQCAGRRAANVAGGGRVAALGANPSRGRAFFHPCRPTLAPETLTRRSGSPAT